MRWDEDSLQRPLVEAVAEQNTILRCAVMALLASEEDDARFGNGLFRACKRAIRNPCGDRGSCDPWPKTTQISRMYRNSPRCCTELSRRFGISLHWLTRTNWAIALMPMFGGEYPIMGGVVHLASPLADIGRVCAGRRAQHPN